MKLYIVLILLSCSICAAGSKAVFDQHQFEIETLEPDNRVEKPSTPLLMSLPALGGFAPNVNVTIQVLEEGIDKYAELTRTQFQAMKLTVIREVKTEKGEWFAEYFGPFQSMILHWYSRAVFDGTKVYLITATAPEKEWDTLSAKMRGVVNSFSLRK